MINVNLIGLPGSGKAKVKTSLKEFFKQKKLAPINVLINDDSNLETVNWLVIDIRSKLNHLQAEKHLVDIANKSSLIIFNFAEDSALDVQSFWQKWQATNAPYVPVIRLFYIAFKDDLKLVKTLQNPSKNSYKSLSLQGVNLEVGKLNLEHLMAGLDACKQNLQMDIWRVKGSFQTTEYTHPVALEATVNRWDTFACEQACGIISIEGFNLNNVFLKEVVDASQL